MPNTIKYKTGNLTGSFQKGNVALGVTAQGPTSITGFYAGYSGNPASGRYIVYEVDASNPPKIYYPANDTELINLAKQEGATGANTGSVASVLAWIGTQSNLIATNIEYENIVTDGLTLSYDAGFVGSYPTTGTTWYDLSGNSSNGTLINGPTFNSSNGGSIVFDAADDSVQLPNIVQNSDSSTTIEVIMKSNSTIATPSQTQMNFILSGSIAGSVDAYEQLTMSTTGTIPLIILKSRMQYASSLSKYSYQVYYQIIDNNLNNYPVAVQKYYNPNGTLFSEEINYPQIINQTYSYIWSITNSDSGTRSIKHYLNGQQISVLGGAQTADFNFFNKNNLALGLRSNSNISILRLYNKALSASEVLQNYNAQKGRFGL